MHELSLCEDLLEQVENIAKQYPAKQVASITVKIGVLSGIEPLLLESAFEINRIGTVANDAQLLMEYLPARVSCESCGSDSEVPSNRLSCPVCGCRETQLSAGTELILSSLELDS